MIQQVQQYLEGRLSTSELQVVLSDAKEAGLVVSHADLVILRDLGRKIHNAAIQRERKDETQLEARCIGVELIVWGFSENQSFLDASEVQVLLDAAEAFSMITHDFLQKYENNPFSVQN